MDSFMIYTEPFVVTGGGPGNSTTFLSIDLVKIALGQFDLGPAAAMSIIYFLIILLLSWVFYTVMTRGADARHRDDRVEPRSSAAMPARRTAAVCAHGGVALLLAGADALHRVPDGADLLAHQHDVQDQHRDPRRLDALAARAHARQLPR